MTLVFTEHDVTLRLAFSERSSVEIEAFEDGDFLLCSVANNRAQSVVLTPDEMRLLADGIHALLEKQEQTA